MDTIQEDEHQEEMDINDYMIPDEDKPYQEYGDLLNVFMIYFKKMFMREMKATMFDHIDYDSYDSTNKCMEMLYEEIVKFNISKSPDKDVLYAPHEININDAQELYSLYINNEHVYCARFLIILLKYVTTIDWSTTNWSVVPLK